MLYHFVYTNEQKGVYMSTPYVGRLRSQHPLFGKHLVSPLIGGIPRGQILGGTMVAKPYILHG